MRYNKICKLADKFYKLANEWLNTFDAIKKLSKILRYDDQDVGGWIISNKTVFNEIAHKNWQIFIDAGFLASDDDFILVFKHIDVYKNDDNFNLTATIRGYKNIPDMALFKEEDSDILLQHFNDNKDNAHYSFITSALFEMIGPGSLKNVNEFISKNKNKINEIRRSFENEPVRLGKGQDGVAFSISHDKVLKIFTNKTAYEDAQLTQDRLHFNSGIAHTEAMIYDVGEFDQVKGLPQIYYYIIEKMVPLDKYFNNNKNPKPNVPNNPNDKNRTITNTKIMWDDLDKLIRNIANLLDNDFSNEIEMLQNSGAKRKLSKSLTLKIYPKVNKSLVNNVQKVIDTNKLNVKSGWLEKLIEEMVHKYATGRFDLHSGNIGLTNYREFRFFDPSFWQLVDADPDIANEPWTK